MNLQGFLLKLDSEGNFVWGRHINSTQSVLSGPVVSESGTVVFTGYVTDDGTVSVGAGDAVMLNGAGRRGLIAEYSADGDLLQAYTTHPVYGWNLVNAPDNTVVIHGWHGGDVSPLAAVVRLQL